MRVIWISTKEVTKITIVNVRKKLQDRQIINSTSYFAASKITR